MKNEKSISGYLNVRVRKFIKTSWKIKKFGKIRKKRNSLKMYEESEKRREITW